MERHIGRWIAEHQYFLSTNGLEILNNKSLTINTPELQDFIQCAIEMTDEF